MRSSREGHDWVQQRWAAQQSDRYRTSVGIYVTEDGKMEPKHCPIQMHKTQSLSESSLIPSERCNVDTGKPSSCVIVCSRGCYDCEMKSGNIYQHFTMFLGVIAPRRSRVKYPKTMQKSRMTGKTFMLNNWSRLGYDFDDRLIRGACTSGLYSLKGQEHIF